MALDPVMIQIYQGADQSARRERRRADLRLLATLAALGVAAILIAKTPSRSART